MSEHAERPEVCTSCGRTTKVVASRVDEDLHLCRDCFRDTAPMAYEQVYGSDLKELTPPDVELITENYGLVPCWLESTVDAERLLATSSLVETLEGYVHDDSRFGDSSTLKIYHCVGVTRT